MKNYKLEAGQVWLYQDGKTKYFLLEFYVDKLFGNTWDTKVRYKVETPSLVEENTMFVSSFVKAVEEGLVELQVI